MRNPRKRSVVLQFDPELDKLRGGRRLSSGISGAVAIGDTLWLAHDETTGVERVRATATSGGGLRYGDHRHFDLLDYVTLPDGRKGGSADAMPEVDFEGVAYGDDYLWVTGSHSAVRGDADGASAREALAALAEVKRAGNRFVLARIPVTFSGGVPDLARDCAMRDGRVRHAGLLVGGRKHNAITRALRNDAHLAPFLDIPSKDNGFDIEGLAVARGGRVFLGLRGPVINGLACVLEIRVAAHPRRPRELVLADISASSGAKYRKHFLDLAGSGIRDLCIAGRDMLVLTGPPMRGKGRAHVRRWKSALAGTGDRLVDRDNLPVLLELPYREKKDHAEGIAIVQRKGRHLWVLVFYDSAANTRPLRQAATRATLHRLDV